jgi:hypothetical protein
LFQIKPARISEFHKLRLLPAQPVSLFRKTNVPDDCNPDLAEIHLRQLTLHFKK